MRFPRSSGVLLHPTSFPGRYGIGEIGQTAYAFVDWLASAAQQLWQIMPLGPTGYGDSPYQSFSAFAGNPLLLSLDTLAADGYLPATELHTLPNFPAERVDYGDVIQWKIPLLHRSAAAFKQSPLAGHREEFERFCLENKRWLDDFALFVALKDHFKGAVWNTWPAELVRRDPKAIAEWHKKLSDAVAIAKFLQWQFFRQWRALKSHANELGIRIIGDIPIFVAYDSADVWANPDLFYLDEQGNPTVVAGVPPDYFSATGQLWGNPLYRWDVMAERGFDWWIERMRASLTSVDVMRIDHFRGFDAYWEVLAGSETAEKGKWVPGPKGAFFDALHTALGDPSASLRTGPSTTFILSKAEGPRASLPIIAEDLGIITPEVEALRDAYALPGMKVLLFAFGGDADNVYLPHNYERHCVVYTGTHDNDTAMGWLASASDEERHHARTYLGTDGHDFAWDLIRLGQSSVADTFIAPMQDLLSLGSEARMNFPGRATGNWTWRVPNDVVNEALAERLRMLTETYGRYRVKREDVNARK